mgnify:FL=1|tara:strand:- start:6426 stop:8393 length:1968 start_codon:yes stop_codon:yes gene_type:complete
MARDGGEIKIKIAGDSSDLENASARAAKALGDVGGSAAKAGKGVDKAGTKMVSNSRRMAKLSDSAENTKDEFGEMSSSAAALGAALDFIDPRLGTAARGLGDMAGAAEGAVRMTKLQGGALSMVLNPAVLAVTATVAAMGGAYFLLTKEIKAANEKIEEQEARMAALLPKYHTLKIATMNLAVAQGAMKKEDMASILLRKSALDLFAPEKAAAEEKLELAREAVRTAEEYTIAETAAQAAAVPFLPVAIAIQQQQKKAGAERLANAQQEVASLEEEIKGYDRKTGALIRAEEALAKIPPVQKGSAKTAKEAAAATKDWAASLLTAQEASAALMASIEAEGTALEKVQADRDAMIAAREDAHVDEMEAISKLGLAKTERDAAYLSTETKMYADMAGIRDEFNAQEVTAHDEMVAINAAARQQMANDAIAEGARINAARVDERDKAISYGSEMSTALIDISSARMDALMENEENMTEGQKKRAVIQFGIMQAASVAQAMIDGYASAAKTMATYGFPAGVPLAAAAIAATGVQVAAITATPLPSFEVGGMVPGSGAVPITAHGGEGVLTARTTAGLGGKSGIDALNSGDISGQLSQLIGATQQVVGAIHSQPVVVEMTYNHRVFDRFIIDNIKRPKSPLRDYISSAAKTAGRTRGRNS